MHDIQHGMTCPVQVRRYETIPIVSQARYNISANLFHSYSILVRMYPICNPFAGPNYTAGNFFNNNSNINIKIITIKLRYAYLR